MRTLTVILSLLAAYLAANLCPSDTSWIEYDHDARAFVGVCGDADGQAIAPLVANHSHVTDVR